MAATRRRRKCMEEVKDRCKYLHYKTWSMHAHYLILDRLCGRLVSCGKVETFAFRPARTSYTNAAKTKKMHSNQSLRRLSDVAYTISDLHDALQNHDSFSHAVHYGYARCACTMSHTTRCLVVDIMRRPRRVASPAKRDV